MSKPSIPKGTRDFGAVEMQRRNYIFDTIRSVYRLHGYRQIETPSMELLSTLMGKYGEEGDRLLFKILDSGDFLSNISHQDIEEKNLPRIASKLCEKGLRYDLTVPFARYVVQHRNDITFPFKRFQIQPVWRADRPQKGRYREFYQCDADVVGTDSLLCEVELIEIINEVFERLNIACSLHINNRKILAGIAEVVGVSDQLTDLTVAMDKFDKIGMDGVLKELEEKGISEASIERIKPFILLEGSNEERLMSLTSLLEASEVGKKGLEELRFILNHINTEQLSCEILFDPSLARGLGYYTGAIMEVKAKEVEIGSITGGGRYDNLTGIFGLQGTSGVGISFGADRIYDVLQQLERFPEETASSTQILFINFGEEEVSLLQPLIRQMRKNNIAVELYPDNAKIKKQMTYADNLSIPYVVLAGSEEIKSGTYTLKNMLTGEQSLLSQEELFARFI
ncbi:histidyl-tRNA synthase [Porphyromonas gingivicanis]|uniref:Histidine--tRNA ligase n=1 Tax=Porphyromonas gingivicanis TaxID=266762 RepID=A0A0A2GCG9_9PORP|nr:histidine--tRNA ligase [Porphyromonas gingivicanis]KGN98149.1 histidyl-tRNA synthase [Porphyromonas gingivicanis]